MWTVIYMAQVKERAGKLRELLEEKGIIVKVRSSGAGTDDAGGCFELLVPAAEFNEAQDIMFESELF